MVRVTTISFASAKARPQHVRRATRTLLVAAALVLPAVAVLGVSSTPAGASVISESGDAILGPPPPLVSPATGQSNTFINFFAERTAFTIPSPLPVDITPNGNAVTTYSGIDNLTPSSLPAGTAIDSYFMYSNPFASNKTYPYTATVTFSTPILGVTVTTATLNATNAAVGHPGTTYNLNAGAGLDPRDSVELIGSSTIYVSLATSIDIDSLRIITAGSPGGSTGGNPGGPTGGNPGGPTVGGNSLTTGYTEIASDGGIFAFNTPFFGSMGGQQLNRPMIGGAQVSGQSGYWTVASDGGIFSFGPAANFYGSMGGRPLNSPIVGMASTPDGLGYWLVASDGGVFCFGDAAFHGSRGGKNLNSPIVGMASTPDGLGYWLLASDGGIFSYGDANFYGSTGGMALNKPVVGMATTPDGQGYWLLASDGGIFSFGDASFHGSMGGQPLNQPMVAMKTTPDGLGYWTIAADGGVFSFGDASFHGSMGGQPLNKPIVYAF